MEVYDIVDSMEWRFAPLRGQTVGWGSDFVMLAEQGMIATIDGDAVRFWKMPFGKRE